MATTETFAKVRPGIAPLIKTWSDEMPEFHMDVCPRVMTTEGNFVEMVQESDLGIALDTLEEGGIPYRDPVTPYSEKVYWRTFSIGTTLSPQVRLKSLYKAFHAPTKAIARAIYHAMQADWASVINLSATSGNNGIDGVVLASASHPTRSSTFSNLSTGAALSATNLETTRIDSGAHLSYQDQVFTYTGKHKLAIPRALEFTARRILFSDLQAGTANNDKNVIGGGDIIYVRPNPFYTSTTRYALIPVGDANPFYKLNGLDLFFEDDLDSDNGSHKYYGMAGWKFRWKDVRGVQFNAGA